jgi:hypothetical protein
MAHFKTLDAPAEDVVTVTIPEAEASQLRHGNEIYAALLAKAQVAAASGPARRALTGAYSATRRDNGDFEASFVMGPA